METEFGAGLEQSFLRLMTRPRLRLSSPPMRGFRTAALILVAFAGGAVTSSGVFAGRADADNMYRHLAVFARVLNYVENNYVDEIDPVDLVYGAIRGMLATLDSHSKFMEPEQYAALKSEARGEFGGIGVEVEMRGKSVLVVERFEGAPAIRAGLGLGDRIQAVDGTTVSGLSLSEVVRRIKGRVGTKVELTVERARSAKVETVVVVRDRIRVTSVDTRRLPGDWAFIRIKSFTERTSHDMARGLEGILEPGPVRGLVLDMRDNPGGLVDEAVRVADTWLTGGVIVSTEGRGPKPGVEVAHPKGTQPNYPIIVLVNGGTASAAEIVAGALQDHKRGVILGTQTFGKGSVQTVIELDDHSALKLTIARYFTPAHRSIRGVGITPDVVVPRAIPESRPKAGAPQALKDNQLEAAIQMLQRLTSGKHSTLGHK